MINRFFTQKILTTIALIALVVLFILLVIFAIDALLLIFGAILFAVFLRGLAEWLSEKTGLGNGLSMIIVGVSLLVFFVGSIYLLAPSVSDQIKELRTLLPQTVEKLRSLLENYSWGRQILHQIPAPAEIVNNGDGNALKQVGGFFSSTFEVIVKIVVFLLLGVYLAAEPQLYISGLLRLFPKARRERAGQVLKAIGETLEWWLVGKFFSMLIIGVMTTTGLWLLGIPLSLTLGLFAAITSFVPNFGPLIAVIPAALIALAHNPISALYVLALYYGIQFVESYLITPNIERHTVRLPPAITISTQLVLSVLIGGMGLVLATPLVAVGLVLVQMLYVEDILGDDNRTPDEKSKEDFTTETQRHREDKQDISHDED